MKQISYSVVLAFIVLGHVGELSTVQAGEPSIGFSQGPAGGQVGMVGAYVSWAGAPAGSKVTCAVYLCTFDGMGGVTYTFITNQVVQNVPAIGGQGFKFTNLPSGQYVALSASMIAPDQPLPVATTGFTPTGGVKVP